MTFDPFGDFEIHGYLRNHEGEKDLDVVRRLEHTAFTTGLDQAFAHLAKRTHLEYGDVLNTHRVLFDAVYPWAGQDRKLVAPDIAVSKGEILFAHPDDIRRAIDTALKNGRDKTFMAARPGEVMGYLAYGHPFLDGNGRTIMVIHSVLAQRAGFSINWAKTDKAIYLRALTAELNAPGKGILDGYLLPFVGEATAYEKLATAIAAVPGLDGQDRSENIVLGKSSEPEVEARYRQQRARRGEE